MWPGTMVSELRPKQIKGIWATCAHAKEGVRGLTQAYICNEIYFSVTVTQGLEKACVALFSSLMISWKPFLHILSPDVMCDDFQNLLKIASDACLSCFGNGVTKSQREGCVDVTVHKVVKLIPESVSNATLIKFLCNQLIIRFKCMCI